MLYIPVRVIDDRIIANVNNFHYHGIKIGVHLNMKQIYLKHCKQFSF